MGVLILVTKLSINITSQGIEYTQIRVRVRLGLYKWSINITSKGIEYTEVTT